MDTAAQTKLDVIETGTGRALVLLHSLLSDRGAFDRVTPRLARERRVVLVDLRDSADRRRPVRGSRISPTGSRRIYHVSA